MCCGSGIGSWYWFCGNGSGIAVTVVVAIMMPPTRCTHMVVLFVSTTLLVCRRHGVGNVFASVLFCHMCLQRSFICWSL